MAPVVVVVYFGGAEGWGCNIFFSQKMIILPHKLYVTQSNYINKTQTKQKQRPTMHDRDQVW